MKTLRVPDDLDDGGVMLVAPKTESQRHRIHDAQRRQQAEADLAAGTVLDRLGRWLRGVKA